MPWMCKIHGECDVYVLRVVEVEREIIFDSADKELSDPDIRSEYDIERSTGIKDNLLCAECRKECKWVD
jgi:hypothetical protein